MKNSLGLLLVTCLTWYLPTMTQGATTQSPTSAKTTISKPTFNKDHFTAECMTTDTATITVDSAYKAVGHQPCNPGQPDKAGPKPKYTLPNGCVNKGAFIIRPTNSKGIVVKGKVYSLSCTDDVKDGFVVTINATKTVQEQNGTPFPEQGLVTHKIPALKMEVLTKDPSNFTTNTEFTGLNVGDVYLGQKVYLTIIHSSSPQDITSLIPLYCQAKGTSTTYLPLWNLTDSSAQSTNKCVYDQSIMSGSFVYKPNNDVDFAFVGMEAFQFQGEPAGEITFICTVRICISENDGSLCKKDHAALTACGPAQTAVSTISSAAAPTVPARKRRDVMETDDRGSLHHVTATLRIRDDVMATDGCSSVLYTVSCLVLAVLAAIVM